MSKKPELEHIRHSLAHLLAMAVLKKFPTAKLGVGPAIENGFYYDFKVPRPFSAKDLKEFEKTIKEIVRSNFSFSGKKITRNEAKKMFKDQPFKLELIEDFSKEKKQLTAYSTCPPKTKAGFNKIKGQMSGACFIDLCRGGHLKSTGEIDPESFKLDTIAGAYWKGDEKNPQLQRIYGLSFKTKKDLKKYLALREEAKKRDHRELGKKLNLFVFSEMVGPGLPLYAPKGQTILNEIKNFSRELRKEIGYQEVQTPHINKADLFKLSGHYEKFKSDMFGATSNYTEEEYFLKPMNCPQHTQIYASESRSYRDLPFRISDFSLLYRDEKPGELLGLSRIRSFSQDDGHCFAREDQIKEEFGSILKATQKALKIYNLDHYIRLSLRDEKNRSAYIGDDKTWKKSQKIMKELLEEKKIKFEIAEGEAAFYGPKMDFIAKDSLSREWQISTIQLDLNMPKRFNLSYTGEDGKKHTPIMIHSALVGSPERFLAILIEHYAGAFPVWLSPVQASILPIGEKFRNYGEKIRKRLEESNIRVEMDDTDETLGKRIRNAEMQKIPYILVIGEKEQKSKTVNVRERGKKENKTMKIENFKRSFLKQVENRR